MKTDYDKVNRRMCEDYLLRLDSGSVLLTAARLGLTTAETEYILRKFRGVRKFAKLACK